jgi:hypothetical protein
MIMSIIWLMEKAYKTNIKNLELKTIFTVSIALQLLKMKLVFY